MLASDFAKMEVYAAGMQAMGRIRDLVIDPNRYILTDFVVEVEREIAKKLLGSRLIIRKARFRVPASAVEKIGDAVVLKFSLDELASQVQKI